jgi:hypothetical protein
MERAQEEPKTVPEGGDGVPARNRVYPAWLRAHWAELAEGEQRDWEEAQRIAAKMSRPRGFLGLFGITTHVL